jgi:steroid delta-isomerase-like uncharacterized protein
LADSDAAAVVAAFYAAYNRQDAGAAAALYAEDGAHAEVATGIARVGRDEIEDGLAAFLAAFPDATWETEEPFVRNGGVAVPYTLRGTLRGPLGPFEPAKQRLEIRGVHVLEVRDGAIVRSDDYWDGSTFARQMRAEPIQEGAR